MILGKETIYLIFFCQFGSFKKQTPYGLNMEKIGWAKYRGRSQVRILIWNKSDISEEEKQQSSEY